MDPTLLRARKEMRTTRVTRRRGTRERACGRSHVGGPGMESFPPVSRGDWGPASGLEYRLRSSAMTSPGLRARRLDPVRIPSGDQIEKWSGIGNV